MQRRDSRTRTKRDVIVGEWKRLGRVSIGQHELDEIQKAIAKRFGKAAIDSPATIARVLADEGAQLRHPEVIEFDARWREATITNGAAESGSSGRPWNLKQAAAVIKKMEKLRLRAEKKNDQQALRSLHQTAIDARQEALSLTKSRALSGELRAEQAEVASWFALWLQTPGLLNEWLELRLRSAEFRERFPGFAHTDAS